MTKSTTDRRKFLAVGGAALMAGLAGCTAFRDTKGTPGDSEPSGEHPNDQHPLNPIGFPEADPDDGIPQDTDDDENDEDDNDDNEDD